MALHNSYVREDGNVMQALENTMGAPDAIGNLMQDMANAAPSGIQSSFKTLADSFKQLQGDESNPFGALAQGFADDAADASAENQVNNYIRTNCEGAGS